MKKMTEFYHKLFKKQRANARETYLHACRTSLRDDLLLIVPARGAASECALMPWLAEIFTSPDWQKIHTVLAVDAADFKQLSNPAGANGSQPEDSTTLAALLQKQPAERYRVISRKSSEYGQYLASAKYVMTDANFPVWSSLRPGQKCLRLFTGSRQSVTLAVKRQETAAIAKLQHSLLMSSWICFPDTDAQDIFHNRLSMEGMSRMPEIVLDICSETAEDVLRLLLEDDPGDLPVYYPKERSTDLVLIEETDLEHPKKLALALEASGTDVRVIAFSGTPAPRLSYIIKHSPAPTSVLFLPGDSSLTEAEQLYPSLSPEKTTCFAGKDSIPAMLLDQLDAVKRRLVIYNKESYNVRQRRPFSFVTPGYLHLRSEVTIQSEYPFRPDQLKVQIGSHIYTPGGRLAHRHDMAKEYQGTWRISVPFSDLADMQTNNFPRLLYGFQRDNAGQKEVSAPILYDERLEGKTNYGFPAGAIHIDRGTGLTSWFRSTINNHLMLKVRDTCGTDTLWQRFRLWAAHLAAGFLPNKDIIYLFEKDGSRYEESSSILYEKLLDLGFHNAWFLLDPSYSHMDEIPAKYQKNLLRKRSFRHYLYFFQTKTFLSSELLPHALDIAPVSRAAIRRLASGNFSYVFLQHGVTYMISLDSPARQFIRPMELDGKYRLVTSSRLEAQNFIENGDFRPEDLYICGMPKFDRCTRRPDADLIIIMPTWRPWEANTLQTDLQNSGYYKLLKRMYQAVPSDLREKVLLLPHPLFQKRLQLSNDPLRENLLTEEKYDILLQQTSLLITDYSSITYDAYYRGSQVIFYWEDLEDCLAAYGAGTRLMLTEDLAFGPVVRDPDTLEQTVRELYNKPQDPEMTKRFRKLVEFHDGHNTDRLIDLLRRDEII